MRLFCQEVAGRRAAIRDLARPSQVLNSFNTFFPPERLEARVSVDPSLHAAPSRPGGRARDLAKRGRSHFFF